MHVHFLAAQGLLGRPVESCGQLWCTGLGAGRSKPRSKMSREGNLERGARSLQGMELLTHVAEREEKGELAMVLHSLPGQPASESVSGDTPTIKVVAPAVGSKSTVESHRMRNQMLQGVSLEEECKQEAFSRTLLRESQRSAGPRVERLANGLTPGEDALRRFTLWEGGGCIRHWKKDRDKVSLPVSVCQTECCVGPCAYSSIQANRYRSMSGHLSPGRRGAYAVSRRVLCHRFGWKPPRVWTGPASYGRRSPRRDLDHFPQNRLPCHHRPDNRGPVATGCDTRSPMHLCGMMRTRMARR